MKQYGFDLPKDLELPSDTVAVALTGSRLYNLATPDSDFDIVAITKEGKPTQTIKNGQDIVQTPYREFIKRVLNNAVPECLMIASGKILILNENYRAILESLRFDHYQLYKKLNQYSAKYLHLLYEGKRLQRKEKSLKTITRNSMMAEKLLKENMNFSPIFTMEEVKEFKKKMNIVLEKFDNGSSMEELMIFLNIPQNIEIEKSKK